MDEGQQYRLEEIRFKGNRAIGNVGVLRNLFALKDGEVFSRKVLAEGLDNLRNVYGEFGYIGPQ